MRPTFVLSPSLPALLLSALLLAAPALARAPAPGKDTSAAVFVRAVDKEGEHLAGALEARLGAALVARDVDVVDFHALYPPPEPASVADAERLYAEGKEAFDNLDPEGAHQRLTEAAQVYARHPVEAPTERLARVFIFLGANALMEGKKDRALEAFRRAVVLVADIEPESDLFGPDVLATFAAAQASLDGRSTQELVVSSVPSGARVMIDGRELGITPLEGMPMPRGRHHVVLTRPGYLPFGAFPDVGEEPVNFRPALEPSPELARTLALAGQALSDESFAADRPGEAAEALRKRVGARFLVLAQVTGAQAQVQVWDVHTGNKLSGLAVPLDDADWAPTMELAERVRQWITAPPPAPSRGLALNFEAPPLLRKWWFWTAVGGTVAAGAGVYAISRSGGSRPDFVVGVP